LHTGIFYTFTISVTKIETDDGAFTSCGQAGTPAPPHCAFFVNVCGGDLGTCYPHTTTTSLTGCAGGNDCKWSDDSFDRMQIQSANTGASVTYHYNSASIYGGTINSGTVANADWTLGVNPGTTGAVTTTDTGTVNLQVSYDYNPSVFVKGQNAANLGHIQKYDSGLNLQTQIVPCAFQSSTATDHNILSQIALTTDGAIIAPCRDTGPTTTCSGDASRTQAEYLRFTPGALTLADAKAYVHQTTPTSDYCQAFASSQFVALSAGNSRNVIVQDNGQTCVRVDNYVSTTPFDAGSQHVDFITQAVNCNSTDPTYSAFRDLTVDKINNIRWVAHDSVLDAYAANTGSTCCSITAKLLSLALGYVPGKIATYGNNIYVLGLSPNKIQKYSLSGTTLTAGASISLSCTTVGAIALSPDGNYLFVSCNDGGSTVASVDMYWAPTLRFLQNFQESALASNVKQIQTDVANNYLFGLTSTRVLKWNLFPYTNSTGGDSASTALNPAPATGTVPTTGSLTSGTTTSTTIPGIVGDVGTGNPIAQMRDFISTSWGWGNAVTNWILGIIFTGIIVIKFSQYGSPLVTAVGVVLGIGLCLLLGFFPLYIMLLVGFLVIAWTANTLFERNKASDGE